MHRVVVRTLSRELALHTESRSAFDALSYLGADPAMPGRKLQPVNLTLEPMGKFFRLETPGRGALEGSIETVIGGVFRLLAGWLQEDARGLPIMHAAVAVIGGQRFVFLGDKGFGKTTLMLSMIERGIRVEGDEHLVVTSAGGMTRPRRLHVKATSLDLCPSLRASIIASPSTTDWAGNRIYACSPTIGGAEWELIEAPIDHLVFVEPNFGGSSILSPLSKDEAWLRVMETVFMPSEGRGAAAASLRKLCFETRNWRLQAGGLDQALRHLRAVAG